MKSFFKHVLFVIIVLEGLLWIKDSISSNVLYTKNKISLDNTIHNDFVFIGDSYAEVSYLDTTYIDYFSASGLHFMDLSRSGMEWESIKASIDSIENKNEKDLLLFIQLGDFINYRHQVYQASFNSLLKELKIIPQLKDLGHHISFFVLGTPLPGTNFYKFCTEDYSLNRKVIEGEILNTITSFDEVYILVNYPFYAPTKNLQQSSAYSFFQKLGKNEEINYLVQSMDIVDGSVKASVSWQNGHPNQHSVAKISAHLIKILQNKQ